MSKKRGKLGIEIWIIITAVVVIGAFVASSLFEVVFPEDKIIEGAECNTNNECVPAGCCHPSSCVPVSEKPDCTGIYCTAFCEPGTLDCGQGSCQCINNKCGAVFE